MNKWQKDVLDFHEKFDCVRHEKPTEILQHYARLRVDLIKEELEELEDGIGQDNIVEVADAITDLLYVVLGTAVAYGIDVEPLWEEVHKTNMAKEVGRKREDGKIIKPPGWVPPDIEGLLKKQS